MTDRALSGCVPCLASSELHALQRMQVDVCRSTRVRPDTRTFSSSVFSLTTIAWTQCAAGLPPDPTSTVTHSANIVSHICNIRL